MRVKVILNPHAGRESAQQRVLRVQSALSSAGLEYELITLCRRGQAKQEAISANFGTFDAVVAAGGDGTVHEVINGLILASAGGNTCPMGILPLGTGNDFGDMADEYGPDEQGSTCSLHAPCLWPLFRTYWSARLTFRGQSSSAA